MTPHTAIETSGLRVSFGDHAVLKGIDLRVQRGTVYALLGPNGAGKTTLVHVLSTLLRPDAGSARIDGRDLLTDPDGVRAAIGLTGQFTAVDELLTAEENLLLMARLQHLGRDRERSRTAELLRRFDLVEAAGRRVATLSGGMRRRLDLAMTLVGDPSVIYLDEPTAGLDPRSRRTMWDIVRELVADGVTVLLTTQYLDEADRLAHRIGVLDRGVLVAEGTPHELKRRVGGGHLTLTLPDLAALGAAISAVDIAAVAPPVFDPIVDDEALKVHVACDGSPAAVRAILDRLAAADATVTEFALHTPDLDDVFLALTGRPSPDDQHEGISA